MSDTPLTDAIYDDWGFGVSLLEHARTLERDLAAARTEVEEQARLVGMGSEREARLMAERDEARETMVFVERWANHHARKPAISAKDALATIQFHPAIRAITESYADGKMPDVPDPYAERDEALREHGDLAMLADQYKRERDEARAEQRSDQQALQEHRAARIAYASEFPLDSDGEPDTGSIHANIRALKKDRDAALARAERLEQALQAARPCVGAPPWSFNEKAVLSIIDAALSTDPYAATRRAIVRAAAAMEGEA